MADQPNAVVTDEHRKLAEKFLAVYWPLFPSAPSYDRAVEQLATQIANFARDVEARAVAGAYRSAAEEIATRNTVTIGTNPEYKITPLANWKVEYTQKLILALTTADQQAAWDKGMREARLDEHMRECGCCKDGIPCPRKRELENPQGETH